MVPIRTKHRLPSECYKGTTCCVFTCCVKQHVSLFVNESIFCIFERELINALNHYDIDAHVYLFMPDHIHILLQGKSDESDLLGVMKYFKQKTGYWLSKNKKGVSWQKEYFDHVLRKDEDIGKHVKYILGNPVRAGLTDNWKEYQFKGTTIYNFDTWDS